MYIIFNLCFITNKSYYANNTVPIHYKYNAIRGLNDAAITNL